MRMDIPGACLHNCSLCQASCLVHWERKHFLNYNKKDLVSSQSHAQDYISLTTDGLPVLFFFFQQQSLLGPISLAFCSVACMCRHWQSPQAAFSVGWSQTDAKEAKLRWHKKKMLPWRNKRFKDRTQRIKVHLLTGGRSPVEPHRNTYWLILS